MEQIPIHYVCTMKEAETLIEKQKQFFISSCGCRDKAGKCKHSSHEVCLIFNPEDPGGPSGKREINRKDILKILEEAKKSSLIARPFRDKTRNLTDGICFCCEDCCGYFLDPKESCDKGIFTTTTDFDNCTHCGNCEEVCYFKARTMERGELLFQEDKCYGCGLCPEICGTGAIDLIIRKT